ncbi:MAG: copper chaperone PCu(A)C [Sulfitobacter sp.]|nr:copper chaperone PCu(A)C [Sulfitobacter sp.]
MKRFVPAAFAALLLSVAPALADIVVEDAYVRASTPTSKTGAAFMMLKNTGAEDDRLIAASSDIAPRVELHTHIEDDNGVMMMREIEGGIAVPAGEMHLLKRGGDHVMFMGLSSPLEQGAEIAVILTFERAGEVVLMIPVDNERRPDHGSMKHGSDG